jgi:hypothetical protein
MANEKRKDRINVNLAGDINANAGAGVAVKMGRGLSKLQSDLSYMGSIDSALDGRIHPIHASTYKSKMKDQWGGHARGLVKDTKALATHETGSHKSRSASDKHKYLKAKVTAKLKG